MPRDDWRYDEDAWEGDEEEEKKAPPPEIPCPHCLHFVAREALYCPWCGKPLPEN
ncbi:MAG: zinc ribbon domain-containing protein [Deltaproteobacteria bacterium]|nr:zinc ribbon domain-containing protein [Deltaproteobacteria bacterium]